MLKRLGKDYELFIKDILPRLVAMTKPLMPMVPQTTFSDNYLNLMSGSTSPIHHQTTAVINPSLFSNHCATRDALAIAIATLDSPGI